MEDSQNPMSCITLLMYLNPASLLQQTVSVTVDLLELYKISYDIMMAEHDTFR